MRFYDFRLMVFLLGVFLLTGCSGGVETSGSCDTDQASTLCEAVAELQADGIDISLDGIAGTLKMGNVSGLMGDVYTAREAVDFIDKLEAALDLAEISGTTYAAFIAYIESEHSKLSPEAQVLLVLAAGEFDITIPELADINLTEYDFYLLRKHLKKQRSLVVPFLAAQ